MVEDERRVAGWQSWMTVRALAANRSGWKENVKAYVPYGTKRYRDRDRENNVPLSIINGPPGVKIPSVSNGY